MYVAYINELSTLPNDRCKIMKNASSNFMHQGLEYLNITMKSNLDTVTPGKEKHCRNFIMTIQSSCL